MIDDQRWINRAVMDDQQVVAVVGCSNNRPGERVVSMAMGGIRRVSDSTISLS